MTDTELKRRERGDRMDDLISMAAAIARAVPLNLLGRKVMIVSVSELENLPSAQPEDCDTCKHGYFGDD